MTAPNAKPRAGEHTKEPWRIDSVKPQFIEVSPNLFIHCDSAANARRIVACVNACEGMPDDELALKVLDRIKIATAELTIICDERDQLREHNRKIVALAAGFMPESNHAMFVEAVSALLAKIRP